MKWKCPWAMRCWGGCCTQKWGAPGLVLRLGKKPSRFLLVAHNQLTNISLVPLADKKQHREVPKGDILFMENPSVEGKLGMKVHVETFFLGEQFSKLSSCWSRLGCEIPRKKSGQERWKAKCNPTTHKKLKLWGHRTKLRVVHLLLINSRSRKQYVFPLVFLVWMNR